MRLRPLILLAVTLLTAVAVAVALMGRTSPTPPTGGSPPTTPTASAATTTATGTATSATPTPSTVTTSGPTASVTTTSPARPTETTTPRATALPQLRPFIAAATRMDQQLHVAARAINAAGPPWKTISPTLTSTVMAADIHVIDRALPAGLPDELRRATLTVYSDLSSRRAAMESFTIAHTAAEYDPSYNHWGPEQLLAELGRGAAAARRFDADLARLEAVARSTHAFTRAAASSRATGERLLLIDLVHKANWGCDARGGGVVTDLPRIRWTSATTGDLRMPKWDSVIPFTAVRDAGGRYVSAELTVC